MVALVALLFTVLFDAVVVFATVAFVVLLLFAVTFTVVVFELRIPFVAFAFTVALLAFVPVVALFAFADAVEDVELLVDIGDFPTFSAQGFVALSHHIS